MSDDRDEAAASADGTATSRTGDGPTCPRCEGTLRKRHCKYVCPQHGVVFDCSDTFWL